MLFKVIGKNRKGETTWLCNMPAASFREAREKALVRYGSLFFERVEAFNGMCSGCVKMGAECDGTTNHLWSGCVYRVRKEEAV